MREGEAETWAWVLGLPPWLCVLGQATYCLWALMTSSVSGLFHLILGEKEHLGVMNFRLSIVFVSRIWALAMLPVPWGQKYLAGLL